MRCYYKPIVKDGTEHGADSIVFFKRRAALKGELIMEKMDMIFCEFIHLFSCFLNMFVWDLSQPRFILIDPTEQHR